MCFEICKTSKIAATINLFKWQERCFKTQFLSSLFRLYQLGKVRFPNWVCFPYCSFAKLYSCFYL